VIPDEIVEQIRESADIVQIIGEHVPLKRVGTDYRGPCPFHQGTHRNFSVSTKKRIYYCFVCHAGGDVFSFLQKRLGMEWPAAVRLVGEKVGIDVPDNAQRREGPDPREAIWEVVGTAAEYFHRMLWEDESGRAARAYLEQRRITREVAERFGLGWAPREIGLLRTYMNSLGFEDDRLLEAGLLIAGEEQTEPRPRFRSRLIFPILDVAGHTVGFGGRLIGPGEPKYLNSAESPVFSKGKLLYGLNWAKQVIRREERALLVEGYFDVVRLVAAGIESVVAPLGTSLTEAQGALLRRYSKTVYLLYDSDNAGLKATFRAADVLLAQGVAVQVVTLPEGEDPDTFVSEHGAEKLEALIAGSLDVLERKIQLLERAGWFANLRQRRAAVDRLLDTIRVTSDPLTRDLYISRASEASGVSKELLVREAGAAPRPGYRQDVRTRTAPDGASRPEPREDVQSPKAGGPVTGRPRVVERRRRSGQRGMAGERALLGVMIHVRSRMEAIAERVSADDFWHPPHRRLFGALLSQGAEATPEQLAAVLEEEDVPILEELLEEHASVSDVDSTIEGSVAMLRVRELDARLAAIDREMPLATDAEKDQLIEEKGRLRRQIEDLGGVGMRFGKSRR
jgi:DNA primase